MKTAYRLYEKSLTLFILVIKMANT